MQESRVSHPKSLPAVITVLALALALRTSGGFAAALDEVPSQWPEARLVASLNGSAPQVTQGSDIAVEVTSAVEGSVALVLVNSRNEALVLVPQRNRSGDQISPGVQFAYPNAAEGETLYADMPTGASHVYVVVSEKAVFEADLAGNERPAWSPVEKARERLIAVTKADPGLRLAWQRLDFDVTEASAKDMVSEEDFVQFFGVRTRSLDSAQMGFQVQFATNSAELTDRGRRQLDAVARGMLDPRLTEFPFLIEGHTDDVGTADFNMGLSARRAATVRQYLEKSGVQTTRLRSSARGEDDPAVEGTTEEARAANRRVVIKREPRK
jgi:outer membrane protein OmpA-like peptidoglycan-associated protein